MGVFDVGLLLSFERNISGYCFALSVRMIVAAVVVFDVFAVCYYYYYYYYDLVLFVLSL